MEILYTENYDDFKLFPTQNRDVKEHIVRKILDSMERNGVLCVPVKCAPDMYIVDGQNRVEAYRRKKLPVPYFIDPNATSAECSVMNSSQTPWDGEDFLTANKANPNYAILIQLMDLFKDLGIAVVKSVVLRYCDKYARKSPQEIKEGGLLFPFDKQDIIMDELTFVSEFIAEKKRIKHGRKDVFYKAIAACYECPTVNNDRLKQRIKGGTTFGAYNDFDSCLKCMEVLYDAHSHNKLFLASEVNKYIYEQKKEINK